ncbi:Uma2 family endonuclease [Occultella glacieicola]|uniref:Uma2 family endonuclease n=1 Tax=Occultella glacieicola TaxID=2518684 RepID=UPI001A9D1448|nr:Uma2 family endonuclease [Occultella glacieicola]
MTAMPRTGEEWTVDDLDRLPDDGLQYELLDGLLLVTPAPVLLHQRTIGNLHLLLRAACTPGYEVFLSPVDWRPDLRTSLQPDLLVVRNEDVAVRNITAPLVLAVEVLSPSTRRKDLVLKRRSTRTAACSPIGSSTRRHRSWSPSTWSTAATSPRTLAGDERAILHHPFDVEVAPADLIRAP